MGDLKYIMFNNGHNDIPIIFADIIPHIVMAELVTKHHDCKSFKLVSAGFIQMESVSCYGDSDSLKIKSRICDTEIIQYYSYDHGLGNIDFIKSLLRKI